MFEALWVYRTSKRSSIGTIYVNLCSRCHVAYRSYHSVCKKGLANYLESTNYNEAMIAKLEELDEVQLSVLDCLVIQKNRAARAYDKKVKAKSFCIRDLVWKTILPIGDKSP